MEGESPTDAGPPGYTSAPGGSYPPPGIYGWRKRCLYACIVLLLVIVVINIALTVWILRVMDFNIYGMGLLRIKPDGIRVEGKSQFVKPITMSSIASPKDSPLSIKSNKNISFCVEENEDCSGNLYIDKDKIEATSKEFIVKDPNGKIVFSTKGSIASIGANTIQIIGDSGITFRKSINTQQIKSNTALRLESLSEILHVIAHDGIDLHSPKGGINITAQDHLMLRSKGMMQIDASMLFLDNLKIAKTSDSVNGAAGIYQLCLCSSNRKLFLAPSGNSCRASTRTCS